MTVIATLIGPAAAPATLHIALERAGQRLVVLGALRSVFARFEDKGAVVAVEDDRAERLALMRVAGGRRQVAVGGRADRGLGCRPGWSCRSAGTPWRC